MKQTGAPQNTGTTPSIAEKKETVSPSAVSGQSENTNEKLPDWLAGQKDTNVSDKATVSQPDVSKPSPQTPQPQNAPMSVYPSNQRNSSVPKDTLPPETTRQTSLENTQEDPFAPPPTS